MACKIFNASRESSAFAPAGGSGKKTKFFSEEITTESVKRRPEFEKLIMVEDNKKIYSFNRVRFTREIIKDVERYINESKENESLTGEWCNFCGNKDLCLKPYLMSTDDMSG